MTLLADHPAPSGGSARHDMAETLAAGQAMADQHLAEVRALEVDLQFAALVSTDPQAGRPRTAATAFGDNRLVQVGGAGTPMVQDLPICELAVARGVSEVAARNHLADALDLDHRLRLIWMAVREGRGHVWVARKVARMSRHLDLAQVAAVDAAVAAAWDDSPARVLAIAEAAIMRADPERERRLAEERQRQRYVALGRSDERGLRKVFALIDAGDAVWLDAMLERIADVLADRPDVTEGRSLTREELRAEALGWLAHPDDVVALLAGDPAPATPSRQRAVVFVHLAEAAVSGAAAQSVARVEQLGPMLADQVARLLGHAHVEVKGVIDLSQGRSVNGYEHPADVRERGFLRTTGDVFPHASSQSRHVDNDHPVPFDRNGPPGQTGDHNHAPLGRRNHRAKTHLSYQVRQTDLSSYIWQTPHGLRRLVDGTGTREIDDQAAWLLIPEHAAALDAALRTDFWHPRPAGNVGGRGSASAISSIGRAADS